MASRIDRLDRLSDQQVHAVQRLVAAAPGASDNPPISEGALLQLRSGEPVRHLLATDAELSAEATGYAQLAPSPHGPTAELVAVDAGAGTELLGALERLAGADGLRLWAHGADSIAGQAARQAGLVEVRALLQLRRSLADLQLPPPELPAGVRIRAFVPGRDDRRWLAVNARAFADHPEQGSWTERELAERLSASWFDPAGFLLAERVAGGDEPELLGYHWTKVHAELTPPVGEVYVLGIDPAAQGSRLGTVLLNEGLRYLQAAGLGTVLLYVEQSSSTAVHLYRRAGFADFATDIQYARL